MIQVIDLVKNYGNEQAINHVSFTATQGEVLGIVGKSGSGKSTLLRLLNLMEQPTSGQLILAGKNTANLPAKEIAGLKQEIGMVFQQFNLLRNKTVFENIHLPLTLIGQKDQTRVYELLQFVHMEAAADKYPAQLSGGEKQRVALARALVRKPKILLCDEATSSLDEETKGEVLRLLHSIHETFAPTILFVSHELSAVQQICQRVLVMEEGRLLGEFPNNPKLVEDSSSYLETVKRSLSL